MDSSILFKMGRHDYAEKQYLDLTNNIVVPSYAVNNTLIYDEWQDANLNKHKYIRRTKITGSFTLLFTNVDDYVNFKNFYKDCIQNTTRIDAQLWVENEHQLKDAVIYMDFELKDDMPLMGFAELDGIEINIEEI